VIHSMPRVSLFLALGLLAAGSGCNDSAGTQGLGLQRTSAAAVFNGVTSKNAGLHPYLAVASAGKQELLLVDAVDDAPVLGPVLLRPLSVPVDDASPALLASGSLGDRDEQGAPVARPDLVVAASPGSSRLQVLRTWTVGAAGAPQVASSMIVEEVDLAAVAPAGARIVSLVATIATSAPGVEAPGRVRVVAGLAGAGGHLAVVEFERIGTAAEPDRITVAGIELIDVGFDPVSLAVPYDPVTRRPEEKDLDHLYAASPDLIPPRAAGGPPDVAGARAGAAKILAVGPAADWTVTPMDVRGASSRLVAAWRLRERKIDLPDIDVTAVDRVYVVPDESSCGADARIDCDVLAVLDPAANGLAPDPAGGTSYLAPIRIPSRPLALGIAPPPVNRPASSSLDPALMALESSSTGATTAVAAVAAMDGNVYAVDLARWAIPSTRAILRDTSSAVRRAGPINIASSRPTTTSAALGVVDANGAVVPAPATATSASATSQDAAVLASVRTTPGFGVPGGDTWVVEYQGALAGLIARRADAGSDWIALQRRAAGATFTEVIRTHDPAFGVRVGDRVLVVNPTALAECAATNAPESARPEFEITALLPPDASHPGGGLQVVPAGPSAEAQANAAACRAAIQGGSGPVYVTVLSGGYRLVSGASGHAGRPEVGVPFELRYAADEDAIAAACPIRSWPEPLPAAPSAFLDCTDAACRAACERWVLARKARRAAYVSERCLPADQDPQGTDAACRASWPAADFPFPNANGPVIAFTLGTIPGTASAVPARGATLTISTSGGITPLVRRPAAGNAAVSPAGVAPFDRSVVPGREGDMYRFFVPYPAGFVLDTTPGLPDSSQTVIR
jgi:hypothetical protein